MTQTLTWIDADGTSTLLDGTAGYQVLTGVLGLDAPPVANNLQPFTNADGSVRVKARRPHRLVSLPMLIQDTDRVRTLIGQAAAFFRGPGTLRFADDLNTRDLTNVVYEAGFEGDEADNLSFATLWRKLVVSLVALDPWWYGESVTESLSFGDEVTFDDSGTDFDEAIGFDGSSANPVTITGDDVAYPVTTIAGPFTTCQVGIAGGQTFVLSEALADGDTIIVDTRPGSRGPRLNSGGVDWSLLTAASRLWTLPVGVSTLNVAATGDDTNSAVEVSYRPRWLTP